MLKNFSLLLLTLKVNLRKETCSFATKLDFPLDPNTTETFFGILVLLDIRLEFKLWNRAANRCNFCNTIYCDISKGFAICFAIYSKKISMTFPLISLTFNRIDSNAEKLWGIKYMWSWTCQPWCRLWIHSCSALWEVEKICLYV